MEVSLEEGPEIVEPRREPGFQSGFGGLFCRTVAPGILLQRCRPDPEPVAPVIGDASDLDGADEADIAVERHTGHLILLPPNPVHSQFRPSPVAPREVAQTALLTSHA